MTRFFGIFSIRIQLQRVALNALCVVICVLILSACKNEHAGAPEKAGTMRVVTTLFPLFDFARTIAGQSAQVSLLMPPGVEPHSFEPKPDDIVRISKAGLFIYTNPVMEPWAEKIILGVDRKGLRVVNAGKGITYQSVAPMDDHDDHDHQHAGGLDPHIWLDFGDDQLIVDNILAGFVAADPANAGYYRANAALLKKQLVELDTRYREGLISCATRDFLHGGHYTFGYLAKRYGLSYRSLSGVSSESEPSATRMTAMIRHIKQSGVKYLFAEELLSPRLTETLATEAGVEVIKLHGGHNLSRDDFQHGVTFIQLMDSNLTNLKKGLACRTK
ncbi:MAG: zinc ABC transporter substrate-binding protein [Desulfuromonadales bacterium]|nr:zinc ABC transporter substrate-binding protein [Desulfuromonadales bacterium]